MQVNQEEIFSTEERNMLLMFKRKLLTSLFGSTLERSMEEGWRLKCLNTSEWNSLEFSPAPKEEKQTKESGLQIRSLIGDDEGEQSRGEGQRQLHRCEIGSEQRALG